MRGPSALALPVPWNASTGLFLVIKPDADPGPAKETNKCSRTLLIPLKFIANEPACPGCYNDKMPFGQHNKNKTHNVTDSYNDARQLQIISDFKETNQTRQRLFMVDLSSRWSRD